MSKDVAWIDINRKHYSMEEITDKHLLNIIAFIAHGGGYDYFLTKEKIVNLLKEAYDRDLL